MNLAHARRVVLIVTKGTAPPTRRLCHAVGLLLPLLALLPRLHAQTGANLLLVVNRNDADSRQIGDYYRQRRSIPAPHVCYLDTTSAEEIPWPVCQQQIERPVAECLKNAALPESVLYIATTPGTPLKVQGGGSRMNAEY
jgi:hypothetical protein